MSVLALTSCTSSPPGSSLADEGDTAGTQGGGSNPSTPSVAVVIAPVEGEVAVRPDKPVVVRAVSGTIKQVVVTSAGGHQIEGALQDGKTVWRSSQPLSPDTSYTVMASAVDGSGTVTTRTAAFSTLHPSATASVRITPMTGWTVGVGMPVVVDFGRTVRNRTAVVKSLSVTAVPATSGAWHWVNGAQVQWRPKAYWVTGTRVRVTAALQGIEVSSGVWGKRTSTARFSIGSAMISTVDVRSDRMTVRRNGKILKVIPITTGKPGFLTRGGIKVIMSRASQVRMDAATTGTDPKDPNYYNLIVRWAMRLTYSGEFLHAAPWSVGSQGHANVSHGCTGMSDANARWMFNSSKVGDVVRYLGSTRPLEPGNGYTAWNATFGAWSSGA